MSLPDRTHTAAEARVLGYRPDSCAYVVSRGTGHDRPETELLRAAIAEQSGPYLLVSNAETVRRRTLTIWTPAPPRRQHSAAHDPGSVWGHSQRSFTGRGDA